MEQFANRASARLDGSITDSATTITVKNQYNCPGGGTFRGRIENEPVIITAVSGNTWTITRGPSPVAHADDSIIYVVLTAESLDNIFTLANDGTDSAQRRHFKFTNNTVTDEADRVTVAIQSSGHIPWEADPTLPVLGNFAWTNQGSATATTTSKGAIWLYSPPSSGNNLRILYQTRPGTNWTCILRSSGTAHNVNYMRTGFCIRCTTTGKVYVFGAASGNSYIVQKYSSPTNYDTGVSGVSTEAEAYSPWWKFVYTNSSGNVDWYCGPDGYTWQWITTVTSITSYTTNPTAIGIFLELNNGSTYDSGMLLQSWSAF